MPTITTHYYYYHSGAQTYYVSYNKIHLRIIITIQLIGNHTKTQAENTEQKLRSILLYSITNGEIMTDLQLILG